MPQAPRVTAVPPADHPVRPPCAGAFRRLREKLSFRLSTEDSNGSYINKQEKAQLLFLSKNCAKSNKGNAGYCIWRGFEIRDLRIPAYLRRGRSYGSDLFLRPATLLQEIQDYPIGVSNFR